MFIPRESAVDVRVGDVLVSTDGMLRKINQSVVRDGSCRVAIGHIGGVEIFKVFPIVDGRVVLPVSILGIQRGIGGE
jgi:hypothetical protein